MPVLGLMALVVLLLTGYRRGDRSDATEEYAKLILTDPPGVEVTLDGRYIGRSPVRVTLQTPFNWAPGGWERVWFEPGTAKVEPAHLLELRMEGYRTVALSFKATELPSTVPDFITLVESDGG